VTGNLNVRAEPAFDAPVKGVILAGEKVTVKEKRGDWYLIVWSPEGKPPLEGWVNGAQFLQLPAGFTP
jgi:uncharacterized protein YgiM (DUF1202 family)